MAFSDQFKLLRNKLKLSKEEMGLQFGFSQPKLRVWEIEKGRYDKKGPSNQIKMICAFLSRSGPFSLKVRRKPIFSGSVGNGNGKEAEAKKVFVQS